jgi:hypothetical protein
MATFAMFAGGVLLGMRHMAMGGVALLGGGERRIDAEDGCGAGKHAKRGSAGSRAGKRANETVEIFRVHGVSPISGRRGGRRRPIMSAPSLWSCANADDLVRLT